MEVLQAHKHQQAISWLNGPQQVQLTDGHNEQHFLQKKTSSSASSKCHKTEKHAKRGVLKVKWKKNCQTVNCGHQY